MELKIIVAKGVSELWDLETVVNLAGQRLEIVGVLLEMKLEWHRLGLTNLDFYVIDNGNRLKLLGRGVPWSESSGNILEYEFASGEIGRKRTNCDTFIIQVEKIEGFQVWVVLGRK